MRLKTLYGLFAILIAVFLPSLFMKSYALPFDVTIIPNAPLPTTVVAGLTTPASYLVINNTAEQRNNVYVKYVPLNVSVAPGGCGNVFTLAPTGQPGDSCVLNLTVSGAVNGSDPNPHHHLFVCLPGGLTCAGTNYALSVASIATSSIALTPASANISATLSQQFQAVATFSNGTTQNITPFATWASSNTAVATVNNAGLATALTAGTTNITATMNGVTSTAATLTVTAPGLAITPVTAGIGTGQTQQYTAIATFSDGSMANVTNLAAWNSSNTTVATINTTGLASGLTLGTSNITATYLTATSNTAVLTVLPTMVTVGYFQNSSSINQPLAYFTKNAGQTSWIQATTLIAPSTTGSDLQSVACDSLRKNCLAAGSYDNSGTSQPLTYLTTDSGNTWGVSLPSPQGAGANQLFGVACGNNAQVCTTVGYYTSGGNALPLTYYTTNGNSGTTWNVSTILPPPQPNSTAHQLNSVACDATGRTCTTVGYYNSTTANTFLGLAYYSINGGKTWLNPGTLPPQYATTTPAVTSTNNVLNGVFCNSAGTKCTAVGFALLSGQNVPISYTTSYGGQTWAVSNTVPPPQSSSDNLLYAVGCDVNLAHCVAVGVYVVNGVAFPLSYYSTDGGNNWLVSTTLPPPLDNVYSYLSGVTCEPTQGLLCTAVGVHTLNSTQVPLSSFSTDGGVTWTNTTQQPAAPAAATSSQLIGVS